jgi:rod shape-determining protein MreC
VLRNRPKSLRRWSRGAAARRGSGGPRKGGLAVGIYTALFGASALLFALDITDHRSAHVTRQAITDAAAPALTAVTGSVSTVRAWFDEARGLVILSREVERLRAENDSLREFERQAHELEARAARYEALLRLQPDDGGHVITARAIADLKSPFTRSLIINAGESDGIAQGNAVLGAEGLIGRVIEAGVNSSRVLLVNDLESRIPVHVGVGRHRSILAGTNAYEPTLMHLPPGANVHDGDTVATSGEGQILPPGLAVGQVRVGDNGAVSVVLASDPEGSEFVRVYNSGFPVDVAAGAPPLPGILAEAATIADALAVSISPADAAGSGEASDGARPVP